MPISVVQAVKIRSNSGTSVTVNAAITASSGNLMVAGIAGYGNSILADAQASDNANGAYTNIGEVQQGSSYDASLHYHAAIAGGSLNLTANAGTGSQYSVIGLFHEVAITSTAPFTAGEVAGKLCGSTNNPVSSAITNSVADSVFFGMLCNAYFDQPTATLNVNSTGSSPTGWALKSTANSQETDGWNYQTASMPYLIVASSGSAQHGWTTELREANALIAAFSESTGGAPPPTGPTRVFSLMGAGH